MKTKNTSPSPLPTQPQPSIPPSDTPAIIALKRNAEMLFDDWKKDLDDGLDEFDECWNIRDGWKSKRRFVGSGLEDFLEDKYMASEEVIECLEKVLQQLSGSSPHWKGTMECFIWVTKKRAIIEQIFEYFYYDKFCERSTRLFMKKFGS